MRHLDPVESRALRVFVTAGAISPQSALPPEALRALAADDLTAVRTRGLVRATREGHLYWAPPNPRAQARRWLSWAVIVAVLLLGPIVFLHLTTTTPPPGSR